MAGVPAEEGREEEQLVVVIFFLQILYLIKVDLESPIILIL